MKETDPQYDLKLLVGRAMNNDLQAKALLYKETSEEVFKAVEPLVMDEAVAKDLVQDAYLDAFDHLNRLKNPYDFAPWVKQHAINLARESQGKTRPLGTGTVPPPAPVPTVNKAPKKKKEKPAAPSGNNKMWLILAIAGAGIGTLAAIVAVVFFLASRYVGRSFDSESLSVVSETEEEMLPVTVQNPNTQTNRAEEETEEAEADPFDEYREVLDSVDDYGFKVNPDNEITGYSYALVWMETEDEAETMLVAAEKKDHSKNVRVFQYIPSEDELNCPEDIIYVAEIDLEMMADGSGISHSELGADGNIYQNRVTLDGEDLDQAAVRQYRLDDPAGGLETEPIEWFPIYDRRPLGGELDEAAMEAALEAAKEAEQALPVDGNRLVLQGTLHAFTYDEVIVWQGQPDPNAQWTSEEMKQMTYYVITLDTPMVLKVRSGDGQGFREDMAGGIFLGSEALAGVTDLYVGEHITFSIDSNTTYWPSDTRIPLGQPGTRDIHILG